MPLFSRQDVPQFLERHKKDSPFPVYLLIGDRYLCHEVAEKLVEILLPDKNKRRLHLRGIDGDEEEPLHTLNLLRTYTLFASRQVIRVTDTKLFFPKGGAKKIWEKAKEASEAGDLQDCGARLGRFIGLTSEASIETTAELLEIPANQWQELFSFTKPADMAWVKDVVITRPRTPSSSGSGDLGGMYVEAFETGIPQENILVLLAETADKKSGFYKLIKARGAVVDLAVDAGFTSQARRDQTEFLKELIRSTLSRFEKKIEKQAEEELLNRVGFHPVAIVLETEKLALHADDAPIIIRAHVHEIIGRTKEDALFELSEALFSDNIAESLQITARLLEVGVHPLVIIASLRNQFRKMLLYRSLQDLAFPRYRRDCSFGVFQKYLEELRGSRARSAQMLTGHPYGIFQSFKKAERFSTGKLLEGLRRLLDADYRLKSSSAPEKEVIHDCLFWFFLSRATTD